MRRDDLYVIESSCGWIKIGRSVDVGARLKTLQNQAPPSVTLAVLATLRGYGSHELTLHAAFDEFRGRGEWFSPGAGAGIRAAIAGGLTAFIHAAAEGQACAARARRHAAVQERMRADEEERAMRDERSRRAQAESAARGGARAIRLEASRAARDAAVAAAGADLGARWRAARGLPPRPAMTTV